MYTTKLTMEERLLAADVAISNALGDGVIMERLSFLIIITRSRMNTQ